MKLFRTDFQDEVFQNAGIAAGARLSGFGNTHWTKGTASAVPY
jgi:membrane-bound inhibitor of C-type lysozyme